MNSLALDFHGRFSRIKERTVGGVRAVRVVGAFVLAILLSACGGGGGGGGSSAPVVASPTVSISTDTGQLVAGGNVTVSWSSTNASSCTASGGWSGSKSTSGSEEISLDSPGSTTFSLSCTGAGGSRSASATVEVLPVLEITVTDLAGSQLEDTSASYAVQVAFNRDPLSTPTLTITTAPQRGTATAEKLQINYVPSENYFGTDTLEFTVEAEGIVIPASATIDVTPVNDPPVVSLTLQGEDSNGFTFAEPTVDFTVEIDDVDSPPSEISISIASAGVELEFASEGDGFEDRVYDVKVSLPIDFAFGPASFEFTVSDLEDSIVNERQTWVIKSIESLQTDSADRLSLMWGAEEQPSRVVDYVIVLDGLLQNRKDEALDMLGFYFSQYLSNGATALQAIIDGTFNVYVMDFVPGAESNLGVETGCSEEDDETFCINDVRAAFDTKLSEFSGAPTADYVSIITGISGRGVNLGNFNVQPLLNEPDANSYFGTPNYTMSVLKHEFGHAFSHLRDDYTADFLLEDEDGNRVYDMSDRLPWYAISPNSTLNDPGDTLKWGHHVEEQNQSGTLPGRDVTDDVSNSAVGAWPGCYVHDSECQRTTYNNVMNGDHTTFVEYTEFMESRQVSDAFSYDPVGEEAFIIAGIRNYLEQWWDMGIIQNQDGDYAVCTSVELPSDLFKLDWYQDGVLSQSLKDLEFVFNESLCVPMLRPEQGTGWSGVGYRVNPVDPELFSALLIEDSFDQFYDVYDGVFSGFIIANCPLRDSDPELLDERICPLQVTAYSNDRQEWVYDSELKTREEWITKYGELVILQEFSAFGEQIQFNWAWW